MHMHQESRELRIAQTVQIDIKLQLHLWKWTGIWQVLLSLCEVHLLNDTKNKRISNSRIAKSRQWKTRPWSSSIVRDQRDSTRRVALNPVRSNWRVMIPCSQIRVKVSIRKYIRTLLKNQKVNPQINLHLVYLNSAPYNSQKNKNLTLHNLNHGK